MSILDSIKGERKLSFGHWRYRLLHWCFNIKNADPKESLQEFGNVCDKNIPWKDQKWSSREKYK